MPESQQPLPPLLHIYDTRMFYDNRGAQVIERTTVWGTEPRGFIRFIGIATIILEARNPQTGQLMQRPQQLQGPIEASTVDAAFAAFPAAMDLARERFDAEMRAHEANRPMISLPGDIRVPGVQRRGG